MSAKTSEAQQLIEEIYSTWKIIYTEADGTEYRLPTNRKAIATSEKLLKELQGLEIKDARTREEIARIADTVAQGKKRRLHANKRVIIATIVFILLLLFMSDFHKAPGYFVRDLNPEELAKRRETALKVEQQNLASDLKRFEAGRESWMADPSIAPDKKEEGWERLIKRIDRRKKFIAEVTPLSPEEYRDYVIEDEYQTRLVRIRGVIIYVVALILYLIVSRRPAFMFWRKGADKDTFEKIENSVGNGLASAAFTSLYTVPAATFDQIHWSNGAVTKQMSGFGANIFIMVMILFAVFIYYMFVAFTMPVRVVVNFLRNYVIYV